jgi:hypothetical protein
VSAVRWGLCCREGDPLRVCGSTGGVLVGRTREYLELLHERFPDSELRTGDDGRLEFHTWVNERGERRRRPEGALRLLPVEPTGTRRVDGLSSVGHVCAFVEPTYPAPPVDLAEVWQEAGLALRSAAKVLGLKPSELSGLRVGSLRPDRAEDWDLLVERLRAAGEVQP